MITVFQNTCVGYLKNLHETRSNLLATDELSLRPELAPVLNTPISLFPVSGDNTIEKDRYDDTTQRVYINKTQYFATAPPEAWDFRVGEYQVCDKWLKDRKGRTLTFDNIQHYQRIVVALSETIKLMDAIDERIPGFPIQ